MRNGRHCKPGALTKVDFAIIAQPLGWVTVVWINIRKRDGEVNVVEIKILKTPVSELFLRQRLDLYLETVFSQGTIGRAKAPHDHGHGMYSRAKGQYRSDRDSEPRRWEHKYLGGDDYMGQRISSSAVEF